MAIIIKKTDPSAFSRGMTFTSTTDFVAGDIVDIQYSFSGASKTVEIDVGGGGDCEIRINGLNRRYPLLSAAKDLNFPAPDLQKEATWINTDIPTRTIAAGTALSLSGVANIQFISFTDPVVVNVY